jgi:hypothetical protein
MQKNFASYELEVIHYGFFTVAKLDLVHNIYKKKGLTFKKLYKSLAPTNSQVTYGNVLLIMDRYHFVIVMCRRCAHCKACKMDFGPSFFFVEFWSTQLCQDSLNLEHIIKML